MLALLSRHAKRALSRFRSDSAGAIAIVFALCMPAFIGAAGVAVDLSQAYNVKVRLANALDKAALAAGSTDGGNEAQIQERVQAFFDANYPADKLGTPFDLDADLSVQGEVTVSAKSRVNTTFMALLGLHYLDVSVAATVKREVSGLEVVLVMDTTGSMSGTAGGSQTKIEASKQAATSLVNTLFGTNSNVPTLWMGVVPFSQSVNIGPSRSSWTQSDSYHWGPSPWMGCVEARYSGGHDMDDTPPSDNLFPKYYNQCSGSYNSSNNWHNGTGSEMATYGDFSSSSGWTTGTNWAVSGGVLTKTWSPITVTNGDFTASTGWTLGTGWTVTGGVLSKTTTTSSSAVTRTPSSPSIVSGQSYQVTFTIVTYTAGSVRAVVGGASGPAHNSPGTYTDIIVAGTTNTAIGLSTADGFRGTIDNMSANTTSGTATASTSTFRTPATSISSGTRYTATYTINAITNGQVRLSVGNDTGTWRTSAGTYTETFQPSSSGGNLTFATNNGFTGTIDNLTVEPVLVCGTAGTVTYAATIDQTNGPNNRCSQEMTPLTNSQSEILDGIDSMQALGNTIIPLGLSWGWRMLSPEWRGEWGGTMNANNLPLDYNTPTMNKVIILMTDGDNDFPSSLYTAYDRLSDGALGTTTKSTADINLDSKLSALCAAIKANNIIIYTIAFGTDITTSSQNMLRNCASKSIYYFPSPTTASLQATFGQIAQNLNSLHITH